MEYMETYVSFDLFVAPDRTRRIVSRWYTRRIVGDDVRIRLLRRWTVALQ